MTRHGAAVPRGLDAAPGGRFGSARLSSMPCPSGPDEIEALVKVLERATWECRRATIPAGFTYLGQFIDHDITFDPTPFELQRVNDPDALVNFRTPRLDLDSLYGAARRAALPVRAASAPERLLLVAGRRRSTCRATTQDRAADRRPAQRRER